MIRNVPRETILEAITRFDSDLRDTPDWQGWEDNAAHKYAIEHEGRQYPVKQIISMATGTPVNAFSGGNEANSYVTQRGFTVIRLRGEDVTIREPHIWWVNQGSNQKDEQEEGILWAPYKDQGGGTQYHWETMDEVAEGDIVLHYANGALRYVSRVLARAESARKPSRQWQEEGRLVRVEYFPLEPPVPLQAFSAQVQPLNISQGPLTSTGGVKQGYLFRFTEEGLWIIQAAKPETVWPDFTLSNATWIFQSNPEFFDATNAVRHLSEMTWLVKQHKDRIRPGDQVFLWESGADAGIIATATVLSVPAELEESSEERQYNKTEERFEGPRLRVKMHIDHVLPQRLLRTVLKAQPALASLSIFRMAQGTNFDVTSEQAQVIQALISRKGSNGDEIPPNVKSWSYKPDEPDLIGVKRIDWSMFNDGTHIPQEYNAKFNEANGGEKIALGESHPVTLIINGTTYNVRIINFRRQNYTGNSYTLRWENNQELLQLLKKTFECSYQYIVTQRSEQSSGTRPQVIVPDQIAEFMAFYKTETPYTYRADLRPSQGKVVAMTIAQSMSDLIQSVADRGFIYEPWQIAAYVTALRTKPFVILAGVTGTGKSKLPKLVTTVTGGVSQLIPVRPDWTDSSEVLGYVDLQGKFRPGKLLTFAQAASLQHDRHHVAIIDEMNLARVEHYFAEVLSGIEDRTVSPLGGYESCPLLNTVLSADDQSWQEQCLPSNLAIVGTVNMDESAHGFSRKVLDRAFTLELSDIDLTQWHEAITSPLAILQWPVHFWYPRAIQLAGLQHLTDTERTIVNQVIAILTTLNQTLVQAQLQVGYRTRDEIALFALHAQELAEFFVTRSDERVDHIDLAILMKVLPRIVGGSMAIRRVLLELVAWATGSQQQVSDDIITVLQPWIDAGRPSVQPGARYPRTAARLYLMLDRLQSEGYTSFWL